jgi:hypothetical protein
VKNRGKKYPQTQCSSASSKQKRLSEMEMTFAEEKIKAGASEKRQRDGGAEAVATTEHADMHTESEQERNDEIFN